MIKLYSWEAKFARQIAAVRERERRRLQAAAYVKVPLATNHSPPITTNCGARTHGRGLTGGG